MEAYGLAYKAVNPTSTRTPSSHEHLDRVLLRYPPLKDYGCIALHQKGLSCAESALMLARAVAWLDNKAKMGKKDVFDSLRTGVSGGLSMMGMVRKLQRMHLCHFPVYMYNAADDSFDLNHGKPRPDHYALVFVPIDSANNFNTAHWTFATVLPAAEPVAEEVVGPTVVYTSFPLEEDRDHVYWRARVQPENAIEYQKFAARGRACDCDWRMWCNHETDFLKNVANKYPLRGIRVTLEEETVVEGTKRAQVKDHVPGSKMTVRLGAEGRVTVQTNAGRTVERKFCHHSESLEIRGIWQNMKRTFRSNKLADYKVERVVRVAPFILDILSYSDYTESAVGMFGARCSALSASVVGSMFGVRSYPQYVASVKSAVPELGWAADHDLTLTLPRRNELLVRLSLRAELTADNVMDTVRRMAAEDNWNVDVGRAEFRDWLARVVQVGQATMIAPLASNACWNCLRECKTYRHICKECKRKSRTTPPEPVMLMDTLVAHVGFRPIWSKEFTPPVAPYKSDVSIRDRIAKLDLVKAGVGRSTDSLFAYFRKHYGELSQRGKLAGPMFVGLEPSCFPRGEGVAAVAFLIRLGTERQHQAKAWFYDAAFQYIRGRIDVIEPETWAEFIAHFSGLKRRKMEEARRDELDGWLKPAVRGEVRVGMTGFTKAEKSTSYEFIPDQSLPRKKTEKPRFICSPNAIVLSKLGRYTHAQTKWLSKKFDKTGHLFYAGCAQPNDLHDWLNSTLSEIPEPWSLVDDISAMDSNHSKLSFRFHKRIRAIQFPRIEAWIDMAYDGEEHLSVRVGRFTMSVSFVNASGVSDTSYKNSMLCLVVRLLAIAHGYRDISIMSPSDLRAYLRRVELSVYMSASGDDGLTRLPEYVDGMHISKFDLNRYSEAWSWAGFGIKVALIPPNRWRMATYLAMRPVWVGHRYEWAPEPARRLKNLFWQFDNSMHPVAWARGVASQVLGQGRAVPVLSHVVRWFLRVTTGPVAEVDVIHQYSAFYGSRLTGDYNERAEAEFCLDYRVTKNDLEILQNVLDSTSDHLVNLDTHAIRRVFAEES